MVRLVLRVAALGLALVAWADDDDNYRTKKVISCVGDSITYGEEDGAGYLSYPTQLWDKLGRDRFVVKNFGKSGRRRWRRRDAYRTKSSGVTYEAALASEPDVVVLQLGTNDAKVVYWNATRLRAFGAYAGVDDDMFDDSVHPNGAGYDVLSDAVADVILQNWTWTPRPSPLPSSGAPTLAPSARAGAGGGGADDGGAVRRARARAVARARARADARALGRADDAPAADDGAPVAGAPASATLAVALAGVALDGFGSDEALAFRSAVAETLAVAAAQVAVVRVEAARRAPPRGAQRAAPPDDEESKLEVVTIDEPPAEDDASEGTTAALPTPESTPPASPDVAAEPTKAAGAASRAEPAKAAVDGPPDGGSGNGGGPPDDGDDEELECQTFTAEELAKQRYEAAKAKNDITEIDDDDDDDEPRRPAPSPARVARSARDAADARSRKKPQQSAKGAPPEAVVDGEPRGRGAAVDERARVAEPEGVAVAVHDVAPAARGLLGDER
ncbi:pectin acetylesterase [Aureococcus anophagefferens]|uniref:Pectin acetylesterase n=1 Tax=Aureococcus anophagefferens TaxID=44056 RepID=A0ABR1FXK9_AURAN